MTHKVFLIGAIFFSVWLSGRANACKVIIPFFQVVFEFSQMQLILYQLDKKGNLLEEDLFHPRPQVTILYKLKGPEGLFF